MPWRYQVIPNRSSCRGCNEASPETFFEVERVPANVGNLPRTREEAKSAQCGIMRLVACHACGLIQNQAFEQSRVGFEPGYDVSLFHTPTFRHYIQSVCDRLIHRYNLREKSILEIGCGNGDFLRLMCQQGGNHGVGIDPTLPNECQEQWDAGSMCLISDYYSERYASHLGDFVCCLSVFEDIDSPLQFLSRLRASIGDREVPVYFEVFNGYRAISECEVWSVHYEQCNYFSQESLRNVFELAGFEIIQSGTCYEGDQYLYVEARPAKRKSPCPQLPVDFTSKVEVFAEEFQHRVDWWQAKLSEWRDDRRRVVSWGSGGKGISFLTSVPNGEVVQKVVDINPRRQTHYIPVSGQPIIDPAELIAEHPDVVILTNRLYQSEITHCLAEMNITCEVLVA